jgi:hypothetical protein
MRRGFPALCLLLALAGGLPEARARGSGHDDLVVEPAEHDFGTVGQNEVLRHTFRVANRSERVVEGIVAIPECGCNVAALSATRLEPGQSATLDVEFHTLNLFGRMRKTVRLVTREADRGEAVIVLRIAIEKGLLVTPSAVSFRDVLHGTAPKAHFTLRWYEGLGVPFEIRSVEVPGFEFETDVAPFRDAKDPLCKGWLVGLRFREPPPIGMFSAEALVRTTHPDHPEVTLPVTANVTGKVWVQARVLSFGAFRQGEERTASIKFRPFDESVKFGEVGAEARGGRLRVQVEPDPIHGERGVWRLTGTVPKDAAPGSLDDEVIELRTGVPGEERIEIRVKGYVREAASGR